MPRSPLPRAAIALVAVLALVGCYTYQPVASPQVGSSVRVTVPVVSPVNRPNAPDQTASIEGVLLDAGDTIVLATQTRREFGAYRELTQYDTLRLGMDQTTAVEVKQFSSTRSIVLGSVLALAAGAAALVALDAGGGGQPPDGGGGEPPSLSVSSSWLSQLWGLVTR